MFDQDEEDIKKMLVIYGHLDAWREIEMDRVSKAKQPPQEPTQPTQAHRGIGR